MLPLLLSILLPVTSLAKPNVLFIVSDDLRPNLGAYADVNAGVIEAPQMHTPNLDKVSVKCWKYHVAVLGRGVKQTIKKNTQFVD